MQLTLTREQARQYAGKNQYAILMFMDAGSDYFACRCCILNALHSGFRLASEAVEKLLKAFIFLQTGTKSTLKGRDRHNPYLLKEELKASRPDQKLDSYDDLLHKLYDHFLSRYYDNPVTGKGASGEELPKIDELFLYLVETLQQPCQREFPAPPLFWHGHRQYSCHVLWHILNDRVSTVVQEIFHLAAIDLLLRLPIPNQP